MQRRALLAMCLALTPGVATAQIDASIPDASVPNGAVTDGAVPDAAVTAGGDAAPALPPRRLRLAVAGSAPFVIEEEDGTLDGVSVDIWREVAEQLGLEYELVRLPNATAAVHAVRDGEYDGAIGPLSITSERARHVGFTQPYEHATLVLLTRPGGAGVWQRVRPFISRTFFSGVAILLAVLLLVGTLIWLAERKKNEGVPSRPGRGIGVGVWLALVTMTTVGYGDKAPVTPAGRLLTGVWMLISLVSVSSLTAGIATALTLSSLDRAAIESAEELRGHRVATISGTTGAAFVREHGARVREVEDLERAVGHLTQENVEAVVFDKPVLEHYLRQHPNLDLVLSHREYEPQGYGFAFPLDSALRREVEVTLLELDETGELALIRSRWL